MRNPYCHIINIYKQMKKIYSHFSLALLVSVLLLFAGTQRVCATNYFKIRVVAVDATGHTNCAGKVFACPYSGSSAYSEANCVEGEYTTPIYSSESNPDVYIWAAEVANEAYFCGWYTDAECTTLVAARAFTKKSNQYGPNSGIAYSDSEDTAPTTTFYAKFARPNTIDWTAQGSDPTVEGDYYLYNVGYDAFLSLYNTNVQLSKDINAAAVCHLDGGTTPKVSTTIGGVQMYMVKYGTYFANTGNANITTITTEANSGHYLVKLNGSGKYWYARTDGGGSYDAKNTTSLYYRWVFVPATNLSDQAEVQSLAANGTITVDASPTATATGLVTFNVSDIAAPAHFDFALTGGDGHFVMGNSYRYGSTIAVPVSYTAQNIHSGTTTPISTATVTITAKNTSASTASGTIAAYTDLQPRFALQTAAMDWSYDTDGETLLDTYYTGMAVAASERARLQNRLVYDPDQTNTIAQNNATWTATITGTDATEFRFANGTQTVSGLYSAELLDIIFAPTTGGDKSATLTVTVSYTDANSQTLTDTKQVTLRGVVSSDELIMLTKAGAETAFATSQQEGTQENPYGNHDFGSVISTNAATPLTMVMTNTAGVTDVAAEWVDGDGTATKSVFTYALSGNTLTINARPTVAIQPDGNNSVYTARLLVKGKSGGSATYNVLCYADVTLTETPLLVPEVTWNWSTLSDSVTVANPLTTTSDGVWTLTKVSGEKLIYNAEDQTATTLYLHHEPGHTATFALSIPQTDTYAAFVQEYATTIIPVVPKPIHLTTTAQFNDASVMTHKSSEKFVDASHELYIDWGDDVYFMLDGYARMTFDYRKKNTITWAVTEYYKDNSTNVILSNHTFAEGSNEIIISPKTVKLLIKGTGTGSGGYFTDVRFEPIDTIYSTAANNHVVQFVNMEGSAADVVLPFTIANKRQVTFTLDETAAQYYELKAAGKTTGSSLTFTADDGLGVYQEAQTTLTVALKQGVTPEQAQTAVGIMTAQDNYTYDNETQTYSIQIIVDPYNVTYTAVPEHGVSYEVTYTDGSFSHTITDVEQVKTLEIMAGVSTEVTLSAPVAEAGYKFMGWFTESPDGSKRKYLSNALTFTTNITEAKHVYPAFTLESDPVFSIDGQLTTSLQEATQMGALSESKTIIVVSDGTVAAGTYTIPAGVTLLIPYKEGQTAPSGAIVERIAYTTPSAYRTLTLADGVHIDVYGSLEMGGCQFWGSQGANGTGIPTGAYGKLVMNEGSSITLQNASECCAWGYVVGDGTIDARRGSIVREQFQMYDWKGGWGSLNMLNNEQRAFPVTQYFIQNIESPVTFRPGSQLIGASSVYVLSTTCVVNTIQIIGTSHAMFLMDNEDDSEATWVRKRYDATNDKQVYEVNSSAHLGNLNFTVNAFVIGYIDMQSANYNLPITNNMKIRVLSGNMDITQATSLLPGAELEIDKEATITVNETYQDAFGTTLENALYLYDTSEWGPYCFSNAYAQHVRYCPSWTNGTVCPRAAANGTIPLEALADAKVNVHGTFKLDGMLYTTASGANIFSTNEDAGTVIFNKQAPSASGTLTIWSSQTGSGSETEPHYTTCATNPAWLRNGDNSFVYSNGTAAGKSYCFMNNRWTQLTVDEDNECFMVDNYGLFYAKPSDYVAVIATKDPDTKEITGNADHTFSDYAGQGRLFILMPDNCQWWEVTLQDNLYYCAKNNKYYYYSTEAGNEGWMEKKFTITWNDYDGTEITTYELTYGSTPQYLGTNPSRESNLDYTYNFTGWTPAIAAVTGDATYTATYQPVVRKFAITFLDENGNLIERQYLNHNAVPECTANVDRYGFYQYWEPAIAAVTADATYTCRYLATPPTEFTVTFKNYDGTTLQTSTVDENTDITYTGTTPTRNPSGEYTYSFADWSPALVAGTKPTSDMVYTATYTEIPRSYAIRFYQEDGSTQIGETQYVGYGIAPVLPATNLVVKNNPVAGRNYTYSWSPAVVGATQDQGYTASWTYTTQLHTVTVNSTGCTVTGAGVFAYGTDVTLTYSVNTGYDASTLTLTCVDEDGNTVASVSETATSKTYILTKNITFTATATAYSTLEIAEDASQTILPGTTVQDLIINAGEGVSGELIGASNLTITGNAYFDYHINASAYTRQGQEWYAFGVPFAVDATEGIYEGATTTKLVLGTDIDIVYYDGAKRAQDGSENVNNWKYVEDLGNKTLQPGTLYMMAFARAYNGIVRFQMKSGSPLDNSGSASVREYASANEADANWNGIANPALYKAYLNTGVTIGQYRNSATGAWGTVDLTSEKFVVGRPVFVQSHNTQTVTLSTSASSAAPLRRMNAPEDEVKAQIVLTDSKATEADRIFVTANEEKTEDRYMIGQDLAKAGISSKVAQMWISRYGSQLCVNTTALENGTANYPITLFAPKAGEYSLRVDKMQGEAKLYLTYLGEVIANLTNGAYPVQLPKGNTQGYGLQLVNGKNGVVTHLDEAIEGQDSVEKVIRNGQLFIIRQGQVYDATGKLIQ